MKNKTGKPYRNVLFLGDLCFGQSYGRKLTSRQAFDAYFANLDSLLEDADLVVANLETTLTNADTSELEGKKRWVHKDPLESAAALKRHGIDLVSLANNHAFDYGPAGLTDTQAALKRHGIKLIGAGDTIADAGMPYKHDLDFEADRLRLCLFAGKQYVKYRYHYYASDTEPGILGVTRKSAAAHLQALREAEPEAFVVSFPHWGANYHWKNRAQGKLAKAMIAGGADLVIGHGAHCLQEIDRVDGRWVVYGIGNSIFNARGAYQKYPDVLPYSLIARLRFEKSAGDYNMQLRLYPIMCDNRRNNFLPRLVSITELQHVRNQLVLRSNDIPALDESLISGEDTHGRFLELELQ